MHEEPRGLTIVTRVAHFILLALGGIFLVAASYYFYNLTWKCDYSDTSPDGEYYFCKNKLTNAVQKRKFVVIHTDGCSPSFYEKRGGVIYFNSYHPEWCGKSTSTKVEFD